MIYSFILLAGCASRMQLETPKQFIKVNDKYIFEYSLETFDGNEQIDEIYLVVDKSHLTFLGDFLNSKNYKHKIKIIEGGSSRQESVYKSLKTIESFSVSDDIVVFHDACRPLLEQKTLKSILQEMQYNDGCCAFTTMEDSVCMKTDENFIKNSLKRAEIVKLQTPQAFKFGIIFKAHEEESKVGNFSFTDDTSLLINRGVKIKLVEGGKFNFKITTFDDLFMFYKLMED